MELLAVASEGAGILGVALSLILLLVHKLVLPVLEVVVATFEKVLLFVHLNISLVVHNLHVLKVVPYELSSLKITT